MGFLQSCRRGRRRGGQGVGGVGGDRYGKGRKNYQRHLTCSSSHYFPQFLSLENMQQHTKTATTCSLQAPCNNSLGFDPPVCCLGNHPIVFPQGFKLSGHSDQQLDNMLIFKKKNKKIKIIKKQTKKTLIH